MKTYTTGLLLFIVLLFCSCSSTKFVPDGEYLLNQVKIDSDIPEYGNAELRPFLRQQPNFKMFGLNRTMLQVYNLAGRDSSKWINRSIWRIGEKPVIFDSTLVQKNNFEFQKLFVNMGYLHVDVSSEILRHNKRADVIYQIRGNIPYRIRTYDNSLEDSVFQKELFGGTNNEPFTRIQNEAVNLRTPRVKEGILFDRNLLDSERDRLTSILQNRGYFAFQKEYITYDADSSLNAYAVDLKLRFRSDSAFQKHHYDKVRIYLDYNRLTITNLADYPKQDSIVQDGYIIYYQGKRPSLRTKTLLDHCFILPNRQYSLLREELTYSSFSALRALNNIFIQYDEKIRNDSLLLDCSILTMPDRKHTISHTIEGTNTHGDLGVASSVNYTHRNIFRGAETFNFRVRGAYETMADFSSPYLDLGGEASIHFPKIVFPFIQPAFLRRRQTSTEFSLSYNYQTRREYDRTLLSGGIRYKWRERKRSAAQHQFDLLDIDYVYLPRTDSLFMSRLPASAKYFGYTNQFIVGMSYSYYNSTFDPLEKQKDAHSLRTSIELAGNTLQAFSSLFNQKKDAFGSYQLLNTFFAQFVKADFDYSKTIVIDKLNSIAWRVGGGIGIPYGNSKMLPFEKRYFSGGANSVRAWSVRELGPGSYVPDSLTTFFNQSGDIKLDLNIEYRTHFFWKLEAAAFIDAGNIWTIRNYEGQEGGKFQLNSFYKEIAVGYGLGFRLDFDYFLIRLDCGLKAHNPAKTGKDRWAFLHPNFGENFAWHVAVGYPF